MHFTTSRSPDRCLWNFRGSGARQIPGIRSATIFGQSIHALIDDHFDLHELREQLLKNGIAVAEVRPLAPSLLPSVFFSGYIFPRETMPSFFYALSYLVPATYFINITRGVILRGAGIAHLWADGLALFAMGTVLLILAGRRFQKKVIMP